MIGTIKKYASTSGIFYVSSFIILFYVTLLSFSFYLETKNIGRTPNRQDHRNTNVVVLYFIYTSYCIVAHVHTHTHTFLIITYCIFIPFLIVDTVLDMKFDRLKEQQSSSGWLYLWIVSVNSTYTPVIKILLKMST